MFKKIPYGVKVRVRGNDETGYVAEYCTHSSRFFPFLDIWTLIKRYQVGKTSNTFPTFELAQKAAMEQYKSWIDFFQRREEEKKAQKKVKRARIIWKHP